MKGRWAGVAEYVGHKMTFKIIDDISGEEICWSCIRSAFKPGARNLHVDPLKLIPVLLDPTLLEPVLTNPVLPPKPGSPGRVAVETVTDSLTDFMSAADFSAPITQIFCPTD